MKGKKSDFLRLTNFKLLGQMKGNSIKARNLCLGGQCDYRPGHSATQLRVVSVITGPGTQQPSLGWSV